MAGPSLLLIKDFARYLLGRRRAVGKASRTAVLLRGDRILISYWIAPRRRIIALTVFAKTRMRETAEIARAAEAMTRCQQALT